MQHNLAESLDEFLDEQQQPEQDGFRIDTKEKADWALRKIARYNSNIEEAKALAQQRIDQINAWLSKEVEENSRQVSFFEAMLQPFAESQIKPTDKKKILALPSGTLGFRAQQTKITPNDGDVLVNWAEVSAADFVEKKPVVKWGELKKTLQIKKVDDQLVALTADGEIVPGLTIEEQPDKFYVKAVK